MKKGVRRIIACLLTLLLMLPPNITALAVSAGSNPTSDGGKIPASQFNIHARGYIVTLRLVPNTVTDGSEEANAIEKSEREWNGTSPVYTEAGYSTISQYYGTFPSFFTSSTIRATSALIALCDSNNKMTEFNSKDNYFIDGSGTRSKAWNRVEIGYTVKQQHAVRNEAPE